MGMTNPTSLDVHLSSSDMQDIVIVGGGPAGAYLAYLLAKKGIQALILDHSHPREKPCGGGISALTLRRFPFIKDVPGPMDVDTRMLLIAQSGQKVTIGAQNGAPILIGISRLRLDKFILDMAIDNGARLIEEKVIGVEARGSAWQVQTTKRKIQTRLIVGADGVKSLVRRSVLTPFRKEDLALAYGYFAQGVKQDPSIMKCVGNRAGYIWVFERGDHTSIGIFDDLDKANGLREQLDEFIRQSYPDVTILQKWAALMPRARTANFFKTPCTGENWMLLGDAAGHIDPISGEGILYALWSAELAAKAIVAGNHREFDAMWREEYSHRLIASIKFRGLLYNPHFMNRVLSLAGRSDTFSKLILDIIAGNQNQGALRPRVIRDLPKSVLESIF
jgi:geranylgeranyl reductase family protein